MEHHFVMAARFSKTLKNKVRITAQWLLPGPFGIPGLVTLFFLPEVRFLLFALCIVQGSDVSLSKQQFLRLVFRPAVFCIGPFLCIKDFSVLYTKLFHLWQLLHSQCIKGGLGSFVDRDFLPMGFQKLFAVTGFAVLLVDWPGLRIIDDVLFQCSDFGQPFFRLLNRGKQVISFGNLLRCKLVQLLQAFNLMVTQKEQRL